MNPNIIEHAEKLALKTLHLATVAESWSEAIALHDRWEGMVQDEL